MDESIREQWQNERKAFLLRLDHEMHKPSQVTPGFREWVERCMDELSVMPVDQLPVEVPWRTHEFLVWLCRENSFREWEKDF